MSRKTARKKMVLVVLLAVAVLVVALAPFLGIRRLGLNAAFDRDAAGTDGRIFWVFRLPRVCVAFLAGAGLAVAGMAFQAVFRNPLATPFTLGVSAGAALGTALYVRLGLAFSLLGISGVSVTAFAGALLSILLVYGLTRMSRGFSSATLLLAGVAVNFFFSSIILFLQYMSDFAGSFRILRWLMGGLEAVGFDQALGILPFVLSGSFILLYLTRELNLMTTGEEMAASRGVNVRITKGMLFFAASLMVGGVVAVCGPIGFVGMMVPHICRLMLGPDHRYLMPATFFFGGMFLTICDLVSRTVLAPAVIPIGIITALLGGPFFLWLLLSPRSEASGL
jgi:iron complex transport system permease protein